MPWWPWGRLSWGVMAVLFVIAAALALSGRCGKGG
jgi:hypothetical protein